MLVKRSHKTPTEQEEHKTWWMSCMEKKKRGYKSIGTLPSERICPKYSNVTGMQAAFAVAWEKEKVARATPPSKHFLVRFHHPQ